MKCLTKKNTQLSQELEECKAHLEAALATSENFNGTPAGNICFERYFCFEIRQACNPDYNNADEARVNPDQKQLLRQLKAGENVLTRVRQEKNKLQDANTARRGTERCSHSAVFCREGESATPTRHF